MALRFVNLVIFCSGILLGVPTSGRAQTPPKSENLLSETDGDDSEHRVTNHATESTQTRQQFDQLTEEFRQSVSQVQRAFFEYWNAPNADDAAALADDFDAVGKQGDVILKKLVVVGEKLFAEQTAGSGRADDALAYFMTRVLVKYFEESQFEQAYLLAEKLVRNNPENAMAEIYLARSSLLTNRFGPEIGPLIEKHAEFFQKEGSIFETEKTLILAMFDLAAKFEREMAIRNAEQQADDLPQVLFKTDKGEFVIELFENEAPQTVANFIHLVESGHYNGLIFQTVIDKTVAETGVLTKDLQVRDIGYTIHDEFERPDVRMVFAGSVVLYSETPNSGGSRFFIALASLPNFHGRQTVFGRIKSGMETVFRLNKTFKIEEQKQIEIEDVTPDRVISATVLRKRDHEYKPDKVQTNNGNDS